MGAGLLPIDLKDNLVRLLRHIPTGGGTHDSEVEISLLIRRSDFHHQNIDVVDIR